jgi:hypothetical protein
MKESEVTRTLLKFLDNEDKTIEVELEKCVENNGESYGRADVVFPNYSIAIECKGSSSAYSSDRHIEMVQGIGQACMYAACGYSSYLCVPDEAVTAEMFDAVCFSSTGLIGMKPRRQVRDEVKLYLYQDCSGGWPFGYVRSNRPEITPSKDKPDPKQILVGGVAEGRWESKF